MPSSSNTEYSSDAIPKQHDWARPASSDGKYGTGPGLQDPDDRIQNSDKAYDEHLAKASKAVGSGPTMRRPSGYPETEHHEHRRPNLTPPPTEAPPSTSHARQSVDFHMTETELQRQTTISTIRTKIGLEAEPPIMEGHEVHNNLKWSAFRTIMREPLAEFFGTFIMVLFGNGSVAQVLLSTGQTTAPGGNGFGAYQSISWGFVSRRTASFYTY
jgi:aquaglyceroporin related protein